MYAGAKCETRYVQPEPPSPEATTWLFVAVEDENGAEYFKAEEVEEEEHVESLNDCQRARWSGKLGTTPSPPWGWRVGEKTWRERRSLVCSRQSRCSMQRGQAIERPISIEAINVGTYELDLRVHGTEFCKVEREIERKKEIINLQNVCNSYTSLSISLWEDLTAITKPGYYRNELSDRHEISLYRSSL